MKWAKIYKAFRKFCSASGKFCKHCRFFHNACRSFPKHKKCFLLGKADFYTYFCAAFVRTRIT